MKRSITYILAVFSIGICLSACKDTAFDIPQTATVNVVNAVIGGTTVNFNVTGQTIAGNVGANYIVYTGQSPLYVYSPAVAATAIAAAIPQVTYYNQPLSTVNKGTYSLFLSGSSPSAVDATIITENYTYTLPDSLVGVRFINLSPNSTPISVDIKGMVNGSEAASLAYKAYTDFKQYPAKKVNPSYIFEFRNASTGALITTYTLTTPTPLFHNVTLVFRGLVGSTPAPGISLCNDY